jgi:hypothetical protein
MIRGNVNGCLAGCVFPFINPILTDQAADYLRNSAVLLLNGLFGNIKLAKIFA